jgi:hypothetical protein
MSDSTDCRCSRGDAVRTATMGVAMLGTILGAVFFSIGIDNLLHNGAPTVYNNAVSSWVTGAEFTFSEWAGANALTFNGVGPGGFSDFQPADLPPVEVNEKLQQYSVRVAYQADPSTVAAGVANGAFPTVFDTSSEGKVQLALAASNSGEPPSVLFSSTIVTDVLFTATSYCHTDSRCTGSSFDSCQQACRNSYGGDYDCYKNTCQTGYVLNGICLVVDPTTNRLDYSWNTNPGCSPLAAPSAQMDQVVWKFVGGSRGVAIGSYTAIQPSKLNRNLTWSDLRVVLRSSQDPYVAAVRVTEGNPGSFDFSDKAKTIGGGIALGVGLIALVFSILLTRQWCRGDEPDCFRRGLCCDGRGYIYEYETRRAAARAAWDTPSERERRAAAAALARRNNATRPLLDDAGAGEGVDNAPIGNAAAVQQAAAVQIVADDAQPIWT